MDPVPLPHKHVVIKKDRAPTIPQQRNFLWLSFAAFFILGWIASSIYASYAIDLDKLSLTGLFSADTPRENTEEQTSSLLSNNRASPADRLKDVDVQLGDESVMLNLGTKPRWSRFTATHSMDPVLDKDSNAIEISPRNPYDIHVGDIISYQTEDGIIIHRVIRIGKDGLGMYYVTKGDNNPIRDLDKVRFNQITGVVVAVVY